MQSDPILYSFRRCPYAMRARMALAVARVRYEVREVSLKAKPLEMLRVSPKATVPVLVLSDGQVIEESLDIMLFALTIFDPENWLAGWGPKHKALVTRNDGAFKSALDHYKYPQRFGVSAQIGRELGLEILMELEERLASKRFLAEDWPTLVDICLFPFIRQFAAVDSAWFQQVPLDRLRSWLSFFVESDLLAQIMIKVPVWESGQSAVFSDDCVIQSPIE